MLWASFDPIPMFRSISTIPLPTFSSILLPQVMAPMAMTMLLAGCCYAAYTLGANNTGNAVGVIYGLKLVTAVSTPTRQATMRSRDSSRKRPSKKIGTRLRTMLSRLLQKE